MARMTVGAVDFTAALPELERLSRELFGKVEVPRVGLVRQRLEAPRLGDIEAAVEAEVRAALVRSGRAPQRIAVGVGSRGIANLARIVGAVVATLRAVGFDPFIVPAMGSHGAASAEGQADVLAGYGISERSMGVPVRATMETAVIGDVDGLPVHMDRSAVEAGAVFLVSRVKPHTSFRGPIESGVAKMCAIGLGKRVGAELIHSSGARGLRDNIPLAARLAVDKGLLIGGLAIVENQRDETALVRGLAGREVGGDEEAEVLEKARRLMPRLPFDQLDVLVVDRLGKDISGTGMDTNVLNRFRIPGQPEPEGLQITSLVALDISDGSHGNGNGIGLAEFAPVRILAKLDLTALYTNVLTAGAIALQKAKLPLILPTDRDAVLAAISTRGQPASVPLRLVWIQDTLHTETFAASEPVLEEAGRRDDLDVVRPAAPMPFGPDGVLRPLFDWRPEPA